MKDRPDPPVPPATVAELEDGLRTLHHMEMQTKLQLERVEALVLAAIKVLHRADVVHQDAIEAEAEEQRMQLFEERRTETRVVLGPETDKHTVEVPKIDCAARMHLCKARCCRLAVALDFQDLDDGLRWEYGRPYELKRRREDGYCVYSAPGTYACTAYDVRPSICRAYDCTEDKRIWDDFEERIPAKWMDDVSVVPLVQIRLPKR